MRNEITIREVTVNVVDDHSGIGDMASPRGAIREPSPAGDDQMLFVESTSNALRSQRALTPTLKEIHYAHELCLRLREYCDDVRQPARRPLRMEVD